MSLARSGFFLSISFSFLYQAKTGQAYYPKSRNIQLGGIPGWKTAILQNVSPGGDVIIVALRLKEQSESMTEAVKASEILLLSQSAVAKINELILTRGKPGLAVRVAIRGKLPGGGYQTEFKFQDRSQASETDRVQSTGGFDLLFDPAVAEKVQGAKVDFDEQRYSAGFNIEYPPRSPLPPGLEARRDWTDPLAQQVQKVIDEYINPGVAGHGGWVLLKDVKQHSVFVEMGGGCQGCGLAAVTLRAGIEKAIKEAVPEVREIIDVTAHEQGEDPYYAAAEAAGASPFAQ